MKRPALCSLKLCQAHPSASSPTAWQSLRIWSVVRERLLQLAETNPRNSWACSFGWITSIPSVKVWLHIVSFCLQGESASYAVGSTISKKIAMLRRSIGVHAFQVLPTVERCPVPVLALNRLSDSTGTTPGRHEQGYQSRQVDTSTTNDGQAQKDRTVCDASQGRLPEHENIPYSTYWLRAVPSSSLPPAPVKFTELCKVPCSSSERFLECPSLACPSPRSANCVADAFTNPDLAQLLKAEVAHAWAVAERRKRRKGPKDFNTTCVQATEVRKKLRRALRAFKDRP